MGIEKNMSNKKISQFYFRNGRGSADLMLLKLVRFLDVIHGQGI